MATSHQLAPALVERVLLRLGLATTPPPTLAGLQALYAAWCRKVPFDNVRKLIHVSQQGPSPLPGDEAVDFFTAWLAHGTGGTCWAGNGALQALLVSLGFQADRGRGTMLVAPNIPPNHGTVVVTCETDRYLVDASILHAEPLRLDTSQTTGIVHPAWGVQCHQRAGLWHIRWRPLHMPEGLDCRLDQLQVTREVFRDAHEQTRPWSPFNYELHARLLCGETIIGITGGHQVEFDRTGGVQRTPLQGDERLRVLVEELGMAEALVQRLPLDRPTPPPPGSRTAQAAGDVA